MHVGELGVRAAREAAALVPAPDGDALRVARVAPGAAEVEALPVRAVGREEHLGVTGQPTGHLPRERAQDVELSSALAPGQEYDRSAWTTTVGRFRRIPPARSAPWSAPPPPPPPPAVAMDVLLAHGDESVGQAAVEGRLVAPPPAGPGDEGALHDGVLVLGEHAGQTAPPVVETQEAPGELAGRLDVGLVPRRDGELAHLLGRPAGCLFGQGGVGLGLGHLDEGLDLVERQLSLGQRVRNLRELPQLGRCGDPFPGRGRGDATPLHEPADHGGGAVDPPGPAPIELHHGCQQLTLVGGDGPVVLRHAGHQRFGAPGHRIGPGTVTEGGRTRHAGGERSHRVGHVAPDRSCRASHDIRRHRTERTCGGLAQR